MITKPEPFLSTITFPVVWGAERKMPQFPFPKQGSVRAWSILVKYGPCHASFACAEAESYFGPDHSHDKRLWNACNAAVCQSYYATRPRPAK